MRRFKIILFLKRFNFLIKIDNPNRITNYGTNSSALKRDRTIIATNFIAHSLRNANSGFGCVQSISIGPAGNLISFV